MNKFYNIYNVLMIGLISLILSGCQQAINTNNTSNDRGIGTQWGEGVESHVREVKLDRINDTPIDIAVIHYSKKEFMSDGKIIKELMLNGDVGMSIIDDNNNKWSLYRLRNKINMIGEAGKSYQLYYVNYSKNTYEIVATVDGLDVINGKAGSLKNNGYILRPYSTLSIKGFRKNDSEVATFTFSQASKAYANHTDEGSANNIGVIGTAIFPLENSNQYKRSTNFNAFPADSYNSKYAKPPKY
jgi:hypothetical protein